MTIIKNQRGIALVLVMILALIALAIVSALLYMGTMGTRLSGSQRFYRTAEEASMGGVGTAAAFIRARGLSVPNDVFDKLGALIGPFAGTSSVLCFDQKIGLPTTSWVNCLPQDSTLDAKTNPDMTFVLGDGNNQYTVFTKIVDTVEGNSEVSGLVTGGGELGGAGVVAANSAMISPPHIPYLYRMEIQAEANATGRERSNLSALYAF